MNPFLSTTSFYVKLEPPIVYLNREEFPVILVIGTSKDFNPIFDFLILKSEKSLKMSLFYWQLLRKDVANSKFHVTVAAM